MATLGHFQGACKGCRPAGVTDEVVQLLLNIS
jgi:Fe-S cluster biogenesis protein NfuA